MGDFSRHLLPGAGQEPNRAETNLPTSIRKMCESATQGLRQCIRQCTHRNRNLALEFAHCVLPPGLLIEVCVILKPGVFPHSNNSITRQDEFPSKALRVH